MTIVWHGKALPDDLPTDDRADRGLLHEVPWQLTVPDGGYTAQWVLDNLPETNEVIIEVFDGSLVVSPRAALPHQTVQLELAYVLKRAARKAGYAVYHDIEVKLGDDLAVPDVTVVRRAEVSRTAKRVTGAVTVLAVEIMSPKGKRKDAVDKPAAYAKAEIPYYLRVEIRPGGPALILHQLEGDQYKVIVEAEAGITFAMEEPFAFAVDPADLLDD
jgi:Uma2 family endonuclease